jgi:hypothetical protein
MRSGVLSPGLAPVVDRCDRRVVVGRCSLGSLAPHLPERVIGNADAAGFSDALQSRRDVHAVTEDVVPLDQYVSEMNADAPFHAALVGEQLSNGNGVEIECIALAGESPS